MSRGILPPSESDWGEFLLTFELGLFPGRSEKSPLRVRRGERAFSGTASGALTMPLLILAVLEVEDLG